jgi:hypothetical protein
MKPTYDHTDCDVPMMRPVKDVWYPQPPSAANRLLDDGTIMPTLKAA